MRFLTITFCAVFVLLSLHHAQATIIHVPADSSTIQGGINGAVNGDTVLVAPGTYYEYINFNGKNIVLASLFLTSADTSHISSTIIDGDSAGSVITITNGEDTTAQVVGFTIQRGSATWGGGVFCENGSSPAIRHNILRNNYAGKGGGIWCYLNSSPIIQYNTFILNEVSIDGGGICCVSNSSPTIEGNTLSENSARWGGAIYSNSSSPSVVGNLISSNSAESGGGMAFLLTFAGSVSNNTVVGNGAVNGGGIYFQSSSPVIHNSIIASSGSGFGLYATGSSPVISYCDVWGNGDGDYQGCGPGDGCISADPLFCDPANDNYFLHVASPCNGTGEGGADMGAFGVGCSWVVVTPGPDEADTATTDVSVRFYIENHRQLADIFDVNVTDSLGWSIDPLYYEVPLDSSQLDSVSFTVSIPNVPVGTTNRIFITAISQTDSTVWDSASLSVTCNALIEGVDVTAGSDQNGYADSIVSVIFFIQNVGVVPDSYSLDILDTQGWDIVPLHYDLVLDTAQSEPVSFTVSIPYVPLGTTRPTYSARCFKDQPPRP